MTNRNNDNEEDYFMNGTIDDAASNSTRKRLRGFLKGGKNHIEFATVGAILGAALAGTSGAFAGVLLVLVGDLVCEQFSSNKE